MREKNVRFRPLYTLGMDNGPPNRPADIALLVDALGRFEKSFRVERVVAEKKVGAEKLFVPDFDANVMLPPAA